MVHVSSIVAYTLDAWNTAVPVIRLESPARHAGIALIHGNVGTEVDPEKVLLGDLVVIQRDFPRLTVACAAVLNRAREHRKPVVYDLDDLLFELPAHHLDRLSQHYADAVLPMLRMVLQADAITVSTAPLAAYLRPLNASIWLQPNYIDEKLWASAPNRIPPIGQPVTVGYMGSRTHASDLVYVAPALLEVAQHYGAHVRFLFWGLEPPEALLSLPHSQWIPVTLASYHDFAAYFVKQPCDILIAPLLNDTFNNCKSAIKYLEYSILGCPGVYSRVAPYESVVMDGVNGMLCGTVGEWVQAVARLIDDPELRVSMGIRARDTVREQWALGRQSQAWGRVYEEILTLGPDQKPAASQAFLFDLASRLQRVHDEDRVARAEQKLAALQAEYTELVENRQHEQNAARGILEQQAALEYTHSWKLMQRLLVLEKWFVRVKERKSGP